ASGRGDVVLGPREYGYATGLHTSPSSVATSGSVGAGLQCNVAFPNPTTGWPGGKVGFQPGRVQDPCDGSHFWSLHAGGANWLRGDASVKFVIYTVDQPWQFILPPNITPPAGSPVPGQPFTTFTALTTANEGEVFGDY